MELCDANVEAEAMRQRTTHINDILARTQEDAFAYTSTVAAAPTTSSSL